MLSKQPRGAARIGHLIVLYMQGQLMCHQLKVSLVVDISAQASLCAGQGAKKRHAHRLLTHANSVNSSLGPENSPLGEGRAWLDHWMAPAPPHEAGLAGLVVSAAALLPLLQGATSSPLHAHAACSLRL